MANLIAFYSRKPIKIAYLSKGAPVSKSISSNIWTVLEDVTDISQITNYATLTKEGVNVYNASFKGTPPFGGSGEPKKFAVIPAGRVSGIIADSFSQYVNSSKSAVSELVNAKLVSSFDSSKTDFTKVDFSKVDWSGVNFTNAKIYTLDFTGVNLASIDFSKINFYGVTKKSDLVNYDFSKIDFSAFAHAGVVITQHNFIAGIFDNVNFSKANFASVDFAGLSFAGVNVNNFRTKSLVDAKKIFNHANFTNVNFSNINFTNVDFVAGGVLDVLSTRGENVTKHGLVIDLSAVDFSGLKFTDVNFSGLEFIGA